ncbi:hypothetical protein [Nocardia arthritidis]|uniref:Uncharacterized protein n=1 Tax=Nocardia arthritidis TaxID=228602 RepID=A0A6G9YS72_9NOCA|nr:hypothetical protein [Nocardia arthritidis]QIS15733.1 hypothetical protein F5544_39575 [Nocardia arthritidis]
MTEAEGAGQSGPAENENPAPQAAPPPRSNALAARWRGSRPLRIVTAVVAAVVIGLAGFGAGLAVGDHGGHRHHGGHHMTAHRWGPGERMHRYDRQRPPEPPPSGAPQPSTQPSQTPAPTPTH